MGFVVTCESCQKRLEIPDSLYEEKFKGRIVSITCRSCRAPIRIDASIVPPPFEPVGEPPTGVAESPDPAETPEPTAASELAKPSAPLESARPPEASELAEASVPPESPDVSDFQALPSSTVPSPPPSVRGGLPSTPATFSPASLVSTTPPPMRLWAATLSLSSEVDNGWEASDESEPAPASATGLRDAVPSDPVSSMDGQALDLEAALKLLPMPTVPEDEQTRVEPSQWRKTLADCDEDSPLSLREPVATIGRYSLFDKFAVGGMATIHLGRLDGAGGFSRVVALKRLLPHLTQNEEFVEMLLKEARLAGRVRHPNVVPTLDVVASKGEVLIVLEYVHGESLSALCRAHADQKELIPIDIAVSVMIDVFTGLHAVHEATDERGKPLGLVHRDVSPANILVGIDGLTRVLDFGVVKALQLVEETIPNRLKGKTGYMSPEHTRGERVTRRSDVFSGGIVLYELLTLHRLASGKTEKERMDRILSGKYERPSVHRPELPEALSDVVMKALAFNPSDRYGTALEVAEALQDACPGASKGVVVEWVRRLAAKSLAERARMVAQVENWGGVRDVEVRSTPAAAPSPREAERSNPGVKPEAPALTRPFSATAEPPRSPSAIPMIAVVAIGCLILYLLTRFG